MRSKQKEAEIIAEMQREKERERRRLRDRERRQNMSREQKERHLARRRRNYQLRRLRAQNASKLLDSQHTNNTTEITVFDNNLANLDSPARFPVQLLLQGADNQRRMPIRLSITDIRHLARRLHSVDGHSQTGEAKDDVPTKRLRLIHIKHLARSLKVSPS